MTIIYDSRGREIMTCNAVAEWMDGRGSPGGREEGGSSCF